MAEDNRDNRYEDRLLPVHPAVLKNYSGDPAKLYRALLETILKFSAITPPEERYTLVTSEKFTIAEMGSNPVLLQFLEFLVRLKNPKRVLEIGTFVGVSGMALATSLQGDARLITVEKFDHFAEIARTNFRQNGFANRVEVIEGDAFEKIDQIKKSGPYDFVFLDGNKERYHEYFELLDPVVAKGGVFLVDDILFHGDVLNGDPKTEKGLGVYKCLEFARARSDYFKVVLPISNGVLMMIKAG